MIATDLAVRINELLRDVPDFPSPGIVFKDIAPLLADGTAFGAIVREFVQTGASAEVNLVAGVEARGFLLAGAVAAELGCGLLPVRKVGKLPPPTLRRRYDLEYGSAELEVSAGLAHGRRVLLLDDVLATGGTLAAAGDLLSEAGAEVAAIGVIVELAALAGRPSTEAIAPLTALLTV